MIREPYNCTFQMSTSWRLNSHRMEPPGRWVYLLTLPDGRERRIGPAKNLNDLVVNVLKVARLEGAVEPSPAEIETQICERAGFHGCSVVKEDSEPAPSEPLNPRTIPGPAEYGAAVWGWLHLQGTRFNRLVFERTVEHIKTILSDKDVGCLICSEHFNGFLYDYPYKQVKTADQCAVWSWLAHNTANRHKGVPTIPYDQAAAQHGWRPLRAYEVDSIRSELRR